MEQRTQPRTGIPAAELGSRRERLLEHVRHEELNGYVLFDQQYIQYFTSFGFLSTERPVVFAQSAGGDMVVLVPEFEVERVRAETAFERVESYPEYPGIEHPMRILGTVLADLGIKGSIGADQAGYPGILGYQGPELTEVTGSTVAPLAATIESMMVRKSESELALIRESGRWCAHAHRLLQRFTRPGVTETEASLRAGHEATIAMLEALGDTYGGQQASSDGASAGYRGDHTPVEPGMVFTIEPGLYDATIGGFRHSDTVAVTPDGIDILTDYPSDIESLTIPV